MSTTDSDSCSDAGKKRKHASENQKIELEGNSCGNESERERELVKKKETKKRKTKEDLQTTQNNNFECVNGKEDVDVDGDVIRKKLKKKKKRRLEREVEQFTANGEESCEHKHKKARVDPLVESHNVEKKKKKKKKHKNEKSSLDFSEEFALQKTKHKLKSEKEYYHVGTENIHSCLEPSILDSPDYTNSINDSSSISSADKERRHKKKKKKKERERERNRTFSPRIKTSENADKQNDDKGLKEAIKRANAIHETWILSKEQLNSLKEKGIKVKSGKWSSKEFNLLHANMDKFLKNHGLADPSDILLHSSMDKEDCKYWRRFALENNFYKCLGEGIQRSLKSIYKCALRIFDSSNYKGKYADEEVEELGRLHAIHGKNWVSIGQLMGRSNMSVCRKFSTLPTQKGSTRRGNWSDDEVQCLKEAVHLVTNTPIDQQAPFDGIYWPAVARMVKTRSQEQCRRKWLERICWTENVFEKNWTKEDDDTLISRLYNSGITEECDVDWMEVKTEFETNYSPQFLRKKWSAIKKKVPDYHQLDFEEIVDYLYQEYCKTKKDQLTTDDTN